MPTLQLTGVDLHYTTQGSGPIFLFIAGSFGHARPFEQVAKVLAADYTVVLYDRRGYSRSVLTGEQDTARRLAADTQDAAQLLEHVSAEAGASGRATIFGTSSGAQVAQALVAGGHGRLVGRAIAHEPAALAVLPGEARAAADAQIEHIYALYRARGVQAAVLVLAAVLGAGVEAAAMRAGFDPAAGDDVRGNALFWFEFELRQYAAAPVELAALAATAVDFVPAVGAESAGTPWAFVVQAIGTASGRKVETLPGGHLGYLSAPEEFGAALKALAQKS